MNLSFNINGKKINLDGIFNIIHGEPGENGDLANILEKNNIFPSIPSKKDMLIMPVYIKNNQYNASLYSENNFYLQWNENNEKHIRKLYYKQ